MTILAACSSSVAAAQVVAQPPRRPQIDANGVDVQRGHFTHRMTDVSIGGSGAGALEFARTYSGGSLRDNFSSMYETHFNYLDGSAAAAASFGSQADSFWTTEGTPSGATLEGNVYTVRNGTAITFNHGLVDQCDGNSGQCDSYANAGSVEFPNGVRWTLNRRDEWAGMRNYSRIQSVTSNTGYQIKFEYAANVLLSDASNAGDWELVTKVIAINNAVEYCAPLADSCALVNSWPQATYARSYSAPITTMTVTGPAGNVTTYTIAPGTFAIRLPGSVSNDYAYTTALINNPCRQNAPTNSVGCMNGSPIRVTSANIHGRVTNYSYAHSSDKTTWTVTATGPSSTVTTYRSLVGYLGTTSMTDPLLRVSNYVNAGGYLNRATEPAGNYTEFEIDQNEQPVPVRRYSAPAMPAPPLIETRNYAACDSTNRRICYQPTSITDARNATTTFTYDAAHGGILTVTGPADGAGVQPVTRNIYGQRYAWIKDSGGSYVQASTPVWLIIETRICRTTATVGNGCSGGAADEVITTYDYGPNSGPNNLALRGVALTAYDGTQIATQRTCYGYDRFGNRISETTPNASLSSCP